MESCQVEIMGYKSDVADVRQKILDELEQPIHDVLDKLSLPQIRVLLVNRYARSMKIKYPALDCLVKTKEGFVKYYGRPKEVYFLIFCF